MTPKRYWRDMLATAFSGDTSAWIAVLPLAAVEQHGPHLPIGTDAFIAEGLVERCVQALPADSPATFLPVQQICKSNEHAGFPGTLTLDWDTTVRTWLDIGASLDRAGIRKLLMITSHGGNTAPMDVVARELRVRHAMLVVTTSFSRLGKVSEIYEYGPVFTDIHGGTAETSVMLALRPDLVDMAEAEDFASGQTDMKKQNERLGFHSSDANIAWAAEDLNPQGVVGDASAASAESGEIDIEASVAGFCELVAEMSRTAPPRSATGRGR